jgi:hypothetical protein
VSTHTLLKNTNAQTHNIHKVLILSCVFVLVIRVVLVWSTPASNTVLTVLLDRPVASPVSTIPHTPRSNERGSVGLGLVFRP